MATRRSSLGGVLKRSSGSVANIAANGASASGAPGLEESSRPTKVKRRGVSFGHVQTLTFAKGDRMSIGGIGGLGLGGGAARRTSIAAASGRENATAEEEEDEDSMEETRSYTHTIHHALLSPDSTPQQTPQQQQQEQQPLSVGQEVTQQFRPSAAAIAEEDDEEEDVITFGGASAAAEQQAYDDDDDDQEQDMEFTAMVPSVIAVAAAQQQQQQQHTPKAAPAGRKSLTKTVPKSPASAIVAAAAAAAAADTDEQQQGDMSMSMSMDFTRSFTAAILTGAAAASSPSRSGSASASSGGFLSPLAFPIDDGTIAASMSHIASSASSPSAADGESDDGGEDMEFTRSFTSRIQQASSSAAAVDAVVLPSNGTFVDADAGADADADGGGAANLEEEDMDLTAAFTSNIRVFGAEGMTEERRKSTGRRLSKRASLMPALNTTAASAAAAQQQERTGEIALNLTGQLTGSLTGKLQHDVLHIVGAEGPVAPTAELPRVEHMGQQTQQVHRIIRDLLAGSPPTSRKGQEQEEDEDMDMTATPPAASAAAAIVPALATPKPVASIAPAVCEWPPQSLQSWLEAFHITSGELEDVQAGCLHLIGKTSWQLLGEQEQWLAQHSAQVPLLKAIQQWFPQAQAQHGAAIVAALIKGAVPQLDASSASPAAQQVVRDIEGFHARMQLEASAVLNAWRYQFVELGYGRLLDVQALLRADLATLDARAAGLDTSAKQLAQATSPPEVALAARKQFADNSRAVLAELQRFQALKAGVAQAREQGQADLHARVLATASRLGGEEERLYSSVLTGVSVTRMDERGALILLEHGAFELEVVWDGGASGSGSVQGQATLSRSASEQTSWKSKGFETVGERMWSAIAQPIGVVLRAFKSKKQLTLILPHLRRLVSRLASIRAELLSLADAHLVQVASKDGLVRVSVVDLRTVREASLTLALEALYPVGADASSSSLLAGEHDDAVSLVIDPALPVPAALRSAAALRNQIELQLQSQSQLASSSAATGKSQQGRTLQLCSFVKGLLAQ